MNDATMLDRSTCCETGTLVMDGGCYSLRCRDGAVWWLEMDRIPLHLVDRMIRIEGIKYPPNLISVALVEPG